MSIGAGQWYLRKGGRILGPFTPSQLASLRDRGRLTDDNELSQDRRSWTRAAEIPGVFARAGQAAAARQPDQAIELEWPDSSLAGEPAQIQISPAALVEAQWFVARGGSHEGPMTQTDVERMIHSGELGTNSLVWKQGMPTWQPLGQVNEFRLQSASGTAVEEAGSNLYGSVPSTSTLAIASLALGLLWLCGLGSVLATILGAVALAQITRSGGELSGKGLAFAGLVLGVIGLSSTLIVGIIFSLLRMSAADS